MWICKVVALTLHLVYPFLDGNGRVGRLLITLYLVDKKLLTRPTLCLADFLSGTEELTMTR